jgi:hypothetical protein
LLNDGRKAARYCENRVLYVGLRGVEIAAEIEGDGDRRGAVVARDGGHVAQALHAVDRFFDRGGDGALDRGSVCAGVFRGDGDFRRCNFRILRDRKRRQCDEPGDENDERRDAREDGAVEKEADHAASGRSALRTA